MKRSTSILVIALIGLFLLSFTEGNVSNAGLIMKKQLPTDKGIGPIKDLKLEPINQKLANDGKAIFTAKCAICHTLDQKVIGPPLRNVTKTRTPEYIMNMILNPINMEKDDPVTKELHKKYIATPMTDQKFTKDQARSLLEYLRTVAK